MKKLIRIATVSSSLHTLLKGQLGFMNRHFEVIGVASDNGRLHLVESEEGIRVHKIQMTRSITPFRDLTALFKIYRFLKKEKPFIVHTHTPKAGTLGMIAARMAGVKHRIHTVAGLPLLETTGLKRKILDWVERRTYEAATLVLPNSNGLKRIIEQNGYVKSVKLQVIGNGSSNGIDTEHYSTSRVKEVEIEKLKKELGISEGDFVFIFVGRLVTDKGINELVHAFDQVSEMEKNCHLILVGPRESHLDPLSDKADDIIENNHRIHEVGLQREIRPYVAISDVLAFPSYREGFPNVVLQAASMNLACIVSDINGCNEIIKEGVNGFIIPPKNTDALKNAMNVALKNRQLVKDMGDRSRTIIQENYSQSFIWNELLKMYENLPE